MQSNVTKVGVFRSSDKKVKKIRNTKYEVYPHFWFYYNISNRF